MGKSGSTTAPIGSQIKNLAIRQPICVQVVLQKQLCSPFCYVLSRLFPKNCRLGKPFSAMRDVIWITRGNSIIATPRYPFALSHGHTMPVVDQHPTLTWNVMTLGRVLVHLNSLSRYLPFHSIIAYSLFYHHRQFGARLVKELLSARWQHMK